MNAKWLLAGLIVALVVASRPVLAHHGGAAYDQEKTVTLSGTVVEMQFSNPHVLVFWDAPSDEGGGMTRWSGWLTAPSKLARAGWTKRTLAPGDKITVSGNPHRSGSHSLQIRKLVGPDGKELPLSEN
jgi:hypothetical protein